jgi:hypothetical protein
VKSSIRRFPKCTQELTPEMNPKFKVGVVRFYPPLWVKVEFTFEFKQSGTAVFAVSAAKMRCRDFFICF